MNKNLRIESDDTGQQVEELKECNCEGQGRSRAFEELLKKGI
jgi:hypothetical protein